MKKITAIVLSILTLISTFSFIVYAEKTEASEPIAIRTVDDLNSIRDNLSGEYYLAKNIVFSKSDFEKGGKFYNNGEGWLPIGDSETPFTGILEGNGYTISNLFSNSTTQQYMGLFGYNSGRISNLVVSDVSLKTTATYRNIYCGTISGYNDGDIHKVRTSGSISAYSNAPKISSGDNHLFVGGITGYNKRNVCYSSAQNDICANYLDGEFKDNLLNFVGGIVGCNENLVYDCQNYSSKIYAAKSSIVREYWDGGSSITTKYYSFTGGIAGLNRTECGRVEQCQNYASIDTKGNILGCIVGASCSGASIHDCVNYANIVNTYDVAGIVHRIDADELYWDSYVRNDESLNTHIVSNCKNKGNLQSTLGNASGIVCDRNNNGYTTYAKIDKCANEGEIKAKLTATGISTYVDVYNSYNSGSITSTNYYASGISIGCSNIEKCFNLGDVKTLDSKRSAAAIITETGSNDSISCCYNIAPNLSLYNSAYKTKISACYSIYDNTKGYLYKGPSTSTSNQQTSKTLSELKQRSVYEACGFDFENDWAIDPDVNYGYPYLKSEEEKNKTDFSNLSYSYIRLSDTDNDLEYPLYDEESFAKQLQSWVEHSEYREMFDVLLEKGYTYKELLEYTVDTPVVTSTGEAYSVVGSTKVKDVMAYLVFSDLTQKYMNKVMNSVESKILNKESNLEIYKYFLDRIKNFNTQYYYFQNSLNGKDAFNQTLYSLLLAKTAMTMVEWLEVEYTSGETKYLKYGSKEYNYTKAHLFTEEIKSTVSLKGYSYFCDLYKANIVESPKYYDELYYYVLSGGDTSYLNSYYKKTIEDYSDVIKRVETLVKIVKKSDSGEIGLGFDDLEYFAKTYDWNCYESIHEYKDAWEYAESAIEVLKSVSTSSVFGLMSASYAIADKYIDEIKQIYEDAQSAEAGWYALAYYYLGKENPDVLKAIVDYSTGSVRFSSNTIDSLALYGVPFDDSDIIQKNIQGYYEKNLFAKENIYSPKEEFKFYLLNACNVANNIMNVNCCEYRDTLLNYILSETNLNDTQQGVYFTVKTESNDSSIGTVSGEGTYLADTNVTLTATPSYNNSFVAWKDVENDAVISTNKNYTFKINSDLNVKAVFSQSQNSDYSVPIIKEHPQSATYYKGQQSKALQVSIDSLEGQEFYVDWYRAFSNTNAEGMYLGSGISYTPPTTQEGENYYYAVITPKDYTQSSDAIKVKTKVAKITVTAPVLLGLKISNMPSKTIYVLGEDFNPSGMKVELQYSDGSTVEVEDYELQYDFSSVGSKEVRIKYLSFSETVEAAVVTTLNGEFSSEVFWSLDTATGVLTVTGNAGIPNYSAYTNLRNYNKYIKELYIEEGITSIGTSAFRNFTYLQSINVPKTVNAVNNYAFQNCSALTDVYYAGTTLDKSKIEIGDNNELLTSATWHYAEPKELSFKGASITLQNNLLIDYKVDKALFEEEGYTAPYVVFEIGGVKKTVREYTVSGDRYIFRFRNIAPNQINDTIYATLYATFDGKLCSSETKEYSIAEYCYNMLGKYPEDKYAKLRTLLVDLLNYGSQSQIYTGHNTSNLANNNLTAQQLSWATQNDVETESVLNTKVATVENPLVKFKGAGLMLNNAITLRFKLQAESLNGLTVKIQSGSRVWNLDYKQMTKEDGFYYLYFNGLVAAEISDSVYLTAYKDGKAVSNTVCYSIESYVHEKKNSTDTNLANLVKAMMKYGKSAYKYMR